MGPLSANGQPATMAKATITAKVHKTLDVHGYFAPQITFNRELGIDRFTDLDHFCIGQISHAPFGRNAHRLSDFTSLGRTNSMYVCQRDGMLTPAMRAKFVS